MFLVIKQKCYSIKKNYIKNEQNKKITYNFSCSDCIRKIIYLNEFKKKFINTVLKMASFSNLL